MIPLSDFRISNEGQLAALEVMRSGRLTYGPRTREFERKWADLHGVRHAIFTNSGTSALVLAIAALKARGGWVDGSEVIVPALTFVATANALIHNNLVPVVVDCEDDFGISQSAISAAITPATVGIIPVHILGRPCPASRFLPFFESDGLAIIEDSCEAVGSTWESGSVGSFGTISCFSTYAAHPISTGVGGFCVTDDDELSMLIRSLMNHGRDPAYLSIDDFDSDPVKQWRIVSNRFKFNSIGHSFRATELEAAIGLDQLSRWGHDSAERQKVGRLLDEEIGGNFMATGVVPMNYPITCQDPAAKGRVVKALEASGVQTRDLPTLLLQPCYKDSAVIRFENTPRARDIATRTLYIGCHGGMTDRDCHMIGEVVSEAIHVKTA